jgi:dihydrofolate reductase
MGQIVLTMQISLDGVVSHEDRWMTLSDEMLEDYLEYYQSVDTIVVGGHSYSGLAEYWQSAEQFSDSALERAIAKRINEIPKIVLSRSERELIWRNSRQITVSDRDSLVHEMEALKSKAAKISVESGVTTWQRLIQYDLFDDLWLFVHPAIVSQGERLFAYANHQLSLNLSSSKTYKNSVVGLYYQKH